MSILTILFICTGNTCRSPLVAALACQASTGSSLRFLSAGLDALPGQPVSEGTLDVAAEQGINLSDHRSRSLSQVPLEDVDWVIGMTRSHVAIFKGRFPAFPGRIGMLGEPGVDLARRPTPDAMQVADPYGKPLPEYRAMADQVDQLVRAWLPFFQVGLHPATNHQSISDEENS